MTDATQYAELRGEMREGFARIDGRLDTLTKAIEASNEQHVAASTELRKDVEDHESRLRVEAYRVLGSGQAPSTALIHVHVEGTAMRCAATSVAGSSPGYSLGHISWSGAAI